MKTKTVIVCVLALLSLTGRVLAQEAPSPVTGITANVINGQVVVQWNAITTDPIDYYRVYYSNYSILDNEGLYDDFEVTEGDETNLTFVPPEQFNDLYIAVIAVATTGVESEFFTEEAYVKVSTGGPSLPPPQPTAETPDLPSVPEHTTLKLLKGTVLSPTEIAVEFSTSITVDADRAPSGLKITRSDGSTLQISSITIIGKTITIHTEPQERGVVYNVQFSEPFVGKNGQALDEDDRSVLVTGHSDGTEKKPPHTVPPASTVEPAGAPHDIQNATIVPQVQADGSYIVTMEWTVDNAEDDLYGIVVYQTRDGKTFAPPSLLPVDIRGVQLTGVTPGFFGLYVQTVTVDGKVSHGVFQYTTLPVYVPGQGFTGDLTKRVQPTTDDVFAVDVVALPAATHEDSTSDWRAASILATTLSGVMILLVSLFVVCTRRRGSLEV